MSKLGIEVDGSVIYIDYEITNNKNAYFKVRRDNTLVVSAPKNMSEKSVKEFVSKHIRKFIKYTERAGLKKLYSIDDKFLYIFGKKVQFDVILGYAKNGAKLSGKVLYLTMKDGDNGAQEKQINLFVMQELLEYISKSQIKWEERMNLPRHAVKVRDKSSTWATNLLRKKEISYSLRLGHFSKEIIDYVIVHELSHYVHHDHSSNFWSLVAEYVPNYKELRKKLRVDSTMGE